MRIEGWESRLNEIVEEARHRPYALGEHDCFRFACRVVEALTGRDRWPEFAGYRTKREALARMARYGSSMEAAAEWFFGVERKPVRTAMRGDICIVRDRLGEKHLGVCLGGVTAFLHENGLVYQPTLSCLCAFSVGV